MKGLIFNLSVLTIFLISSKCCLAQEDEWVDQEVYLIGNTATSEISEAHLAPLQKQLLREELPFTLLHLGDITQPGNPGNWAQDLDLLFKLVKDRENGQIIFTPGDKDWDNSEKDGLSLVRKLEKSVENRADGANIFLPSEGCPGPEVVDLSPTLRLIVLNTQWWMHPFDIPEAPDADCNNLTKEEFIESLEETINDSQGRNILLVGHHPLKSSGVYGGHMTFETHLFPFAETKPGNRVPVPFLGSFYAAYRQNVGSVRDMANENYKDFIHHMRGILSRHPGLIYTSAHDYSLQLLEYEEAYQVISGSIIENERTGKETGEMFASSQCGYAKLEYYNSGKIQISYFTAGEQESSEIYSTLLFRSGCNELAPQRVPVNRYYIPCLAEEEISPVLTEAFPDDSALVSGGEYPAKGMKKVLLGSLNRATWQTPVSIPYLNLDTTFSGLTPFALGGGRQTTTLKFRAGNGREYAFRSMALSMTSSVIFFTRSDEICSQSW